MRLKCPDLSRRNEPSTGSRQVPTVLVGQTTEKRHDQVTSRQSAEACCDWTPVMLARASLPLVAKIISCHRRPKVGEDDCCTKSQISLGFLTF
ncbi:hypothetical protein ElyMa_004630200 [Elysia marginata]|uniref:Uncharacterized protein n=1 Tax=Elysia marginata TaxID=1093978 RepID=A0AAV4I3Y2_9GAST|nr:hypothetical protein ElyMa_004630200 [Elysia marginata]